QFGRPSGIYITSDDTIYVTDSESGPDTGAHELMGIRKGIRIGSAKDGSVTAFIEDMEPTVPDHSGAEGVGVDAKGNVYGGVVRVDTKYPGYGKPILDQVKSITSKPVTTIVNTHTHNDHTGGNTEFPKTVEFVVQENTRANMARMDHFKGEGAAYLPKRTFK